MRRSIDSLIGVGIVEFDVFCCKLVNIGIYGDGIIIGVKGRF